MDSTSSSKQEIASIRSLTPDPADFSWHETPPELLLDLDSDSDCSTLLEHQDLSSYHEDSTGNEDFESNLPDLSDEEDGINIEQDPLFLSRDTVYNNTDDDNDGDDSNIPAAMLEHPALRNAYVHAFVDAAYRGATHESVKSMLTSTHSTIRTMLADVAISPPGLDLDNMARTLRTVERRLGVDPDKIITYYFLCPDCWKVYHPSHLSNLKSPMCTARNCSATIYTTKRTANKLEKRTPCKVMPSASLEKALQHLLMRPGKWDELQSWRQEFDIGPGLPLSRDKWLAQLNMEKPLCDVTDGWVWRSIPAGAERFWDPDRKKVQDLNARRVLQRHVSLECGIVLQINLDWYVPRRSSLY